MTVQLAISGCCGRMGSRIAAIAAQDSAFAIAAALEAAGHAAVGHELKSVLGINGNTTVRVTDDAKAAIRAAEVLIEFTRPEPTLAHLQIARQLRKPMVIGTTGFSDSDRASVAEAAAEIPIVFSPNMSVGVNVLFELVQTAARQLGLAYDVEIVEAHHRAKQDSPSGTAKRLAEAVAASRKQPPGSIPVHAIRAGDIIGDHRVVFAGPSERLELTHQAHSRDVFVVGALRAARFLATTKTPGLYDMGHVLRADRPTS